MRPITEVRPLPLTSFSGIMTSPQTICAFDVPSASFARSILIWGPIEVAAVDSSAATTPVDVEVLLDDPVAGEVIARGFSRQSRRRSGELTVAVCPRPTAIPADVKSTVYVNLIPGSTPVLCEFDAAENSNLMMTEIGT